MSKTKKSSKKSQKPKKIKKVSPQAEFLKTLIYHTEINIKNDKTEVDRFFKDQLERLSKDLKQLK